MAQTKPKRIGLIIGREWDWPSAFMTAVNQQNNHARAELIKLGGTVLGEPCRYEVIIDRMSHEIPYYRAYLKYAAIQGVDVINNPFVWTVDNRFLGHVAIDKLGLLSPRTIVLPNKEVERDVVSDSFRNLKYPMDWQGIMDYVGVPAILKDIRIGGRRLVYRVHSLDELIQRYDESGTRTMILQEIIESETHVHCFVVGQQKVLMLHYSLENGRYLPTAHQDNTLKDYFVRTARLLTQVYGYDINMVEFVVRRGQPYVINSTNPAPIMDRKLMMPDQFNWCVEEVVKLALDRVQQPRILPHLLQFPADEGETADDP